MEHREKGPSRFWYVIAGLIFLFGVGSGIWTIFQAVTGMPDQLVRVMIPGSIQVELSETGTYTIFHEYRSYLDGQLYETRGNLNGLVCTISSVSSTESIPVVPSNFSENYSIGSREGEALYKFTILNPGSYNVSAAFSDGRSQPQAMLAIGQNIVGNIIMAIFAPIAIIGGCTVLAALMAIVVFVKRNSARTRLVNVDENH